MVANRSAGVFASARAIAAASIAETDSRMAATGGAATSKCCRMMLSALGPNIRVHQSGGDPDLAEESLGSQRCGAFRTHHLYRDVAAVLAVMRELHHGHSTLPQLSIDSVSLPDSGCEGACQA